ncbi:hypothetical protein K1719_016558 [Acacia pycnantha]|nr:hypothetical protein K1719_016558 [Acacia pycnantha]
MWLVKVNNAKDQMSAEYHSHEALWCGILDSLISSNTTCSDCVLGKKPTAPNSITTAIFCFIASSISGASGIGGGALFIPILTIEAKQDLKTASSLSSFMITGGSIANVMFNLRRTNFRGKSLIDYDIALSFRTMHASWCECWSYLQHGVPKMIETSMAEIRGFVSGLAFFLRNLFSSRR